MDYFQGKPCLVENFEEEFGALAGRAYLDHAGATLYSRSQLATVHAALGRHLYGNPHTRSLASRHSTDAVDQARFRLLQHFNTSGDDYAVVFTSGATAALALLADAFQFGGDAAAPGSFVYLQESHTSVLGVRGRLAGRPVTVSALAPAAAAAAFSAAAADQQSDDTRRGLFAFPALCNFSGRKYPLEWVTQARRGALDGLTAGRRLRGRGHVAGCRWYCLLDAAGHVGTNDLDLSRAQPDFVCLSFYKMFGYPTGLGALLVHRRAQHTLQKAYFGGGTVQVSLAGEDFHVARSELHERLEDGTLPFLAIAAVTHGLDTVRRLAGPMKAVSAHVFGLAQYTYRHLSALRHSNGSPVVRIYSDTEYDDIETQGGIISFNLLRPDGAFFGSTEVEKFAGVYDIDLRTGCFCNPGACQRFLGLSTETVKEHFQAGHVCGDETDLIDGRPTGAVRASFGYMSRRADADRLLLMRAASSAAGAAGGGGGQQVEPSGGRLVAPASGVRDQGAPLAMQNGPSARPAAAEVGPRLTEVVVFPVKSCAGFSVPWWPLGPRGLLYDRHWMVVAAGGSALTQKRQPSLCRVRPEVSLHTGRLLLHADGFGSVAVPLAPDPALSVTSLTLCESRVCGDRVGGLDCGDAAADWLSQVLDLEGVRLVRQNPASARSSKVNGSSGLLSLSNESPYVLVSRSSVAALRSAMQERGVDDGVSEAELTDRFRANLVVAGLPPYEEERMELVTLGDTTLRMLGDCSRCQMICVDQATGERSREPLLTLSAARGRRMPFGVHLVIGFEMVDSS
ncbi:molybdenum cofactor sulfurase-like [Pollicipes pollicipes]|uniref:molybdenum cofactor sulfurase-like n=1 Tax=Pollicipes pollicipes TaxID=41117 RepID=UPI0018855269|nr:molybdenum cofactor sulfurase-like [Pollicipes pollicipes]